MPVLDKYWITVEISANCWCQTDIRITYWEQNFIFRHCMLSADVQLAKYLHLSYNQIEKLTLHPTRAECWELTFNFRCQLSTNVQFWANIA